MKSIRTLAGQFVPEGIGEEDVADGDCILEERSDLAVFEPCDAAADAGDEEAHLGMRPGKLDKVVDVWLDGVHAALHSRDGIALSLQPNTFAPDGSELLISGVGGTTAMLSGQIAAEDEDFTVGKFGNVRRGYALLPVVGSRGERYIDAIHCPICSGALELRKNLFEDSGKMLHSLINHFFRDVFVECFGNAAGDAGQSVAVASQRYGLADGILKVGGVQEGYDGLRNSTLAAGFPMIDRMPVFPGLKE